MIDETHELWLLVDARAGLLIQESLGESELYEVQDLLDSLHPGERHGMDKFPRVGHDTRVSMIIV